MTPYRLPTISTGFERMNGNGFVLDGRHRRRKSPFDTEVEFAQMSGRVLCVCGNDQVCEEKAGFPNLLMIATGLQYCGRADSITRAVPETESGAGRCERPVESTATSVVPGGRREWLFHRLSNRALLFCGVPFHRVLWQMSACLRYPFGLELHGPGRDGEGATLGLERKLIQTG